MVTRARRRDSMATRAMCLWIPTASSTQPPTNRGNLFAKNHFQTDLDTDTVTCPAGHTAPIRRNAAGEGLARFAGACADCPLRPECTESSRGRSIRVGPHERLLAEARERQQDPDWPTTEPPAPRSNVRSAT